jgi:hypothetical protein
VDARDKRGHDEEGNAVITGLVPVIPLRSAQLCQMNRDGRDIGVRKHAYIPVIHVFAASMS